MFSYFDSSALVKLVSTEPGHDVARGLWDESTVVASTLAYAEVCAGIAAARRDGRLREREHSEALAIWQSYWAEVDRIDLADDLAHGAGELAARHALAGADAVHLASAVSLGDPVRFVAWDKRLRAAAIAEGMEIAPAVLQAGIT